MDNQPEFMVSANAIIGGKNNLVCFKARGVNSDEFKSAGLHEKQAEATWDFGNHLGMCLGTQGNEGKPMSIWHIATLSGCTLHSSQHFAKQQLKTP